MNYLKVFTDFAAVIEPLGDAECGRLFKAMLAYASTGTEPDFHGNERFIWPAAKQNIDRTAAFSEKQRENGSLGGRPKNPTKPCETQNNPTKPSESPKDKDKEKDKEILKEKIKKENFVPPTVDEVRAYCRERKNAVNPAAFVNFYASKGWKVGKDKMVDWRAAVRTWEQKEKPTGKNAPPTMEVSRPAVATNRAVLEKLRGLTDD